MVRFKLQAGQDIEAQHADWKRGHSLVVHTTSGTVAVAHGSTDGTFGGYAPPSANLVVCCYPKQQQAQNPSLRVVGSWTETTRIFINDEELVVIPSSHEWTIDKKQLLPKGGWFYN